METKNSNPFLTILGGVVGGMTLAYVTSRRDIHSGEPTVIDKLKQFENKLYLEGKTRAETFKEIKMDAKIEVEKDANLI